MLVVKGTYVWFIVRRAKGLFVVRRLYALFVVRNIYVLFVVRITYDLFIVRSTYFFFVVRNTYVVHSIRFQTYFVQAFKIVVDSRKFSMLLLYILWDDWPIFMISHSNEQLQQQLEYTLLKPDCHSWWISKMQSGREDTLEKPYAIKFCFKLGKNAATETYGMLQTGFGASCMNRASVFAWHKRFKEGRVSVRDDERYGRSKEVNTPELIGQRVVRLRVTMLTF